MKYPGFTHYPQGKSLVPVLLGYSSDNLGSGSSIMPTFSHNFAMSQLVLCSTSIFHELFDNQGVGLSPQGLESTDFNQSPTKMTRDVSSQLWTACDFSDKSVQVVLMGYSVRTTEFRYSAYIKVDKSTLSPDFTELELTPWAEGR